MDLALELGVSVAVLKATMDESEFVMWKHYADKKMLPSRRIEVYLAQVAQVTAGGKLSDFLMDRLTTNGGQDVIEAVAKASHGIVKLGQGRKNGGR